MSSQALVHFKKYTKFRALNSGETSVVVTEGICIKCNEPFRANFSNHFQECIDKYCNKCILIVAAPLVFNNFK